MTAGPPPLPTCPICQMILDPNGTCPSCRAPEEWNDQIEAIDFVLRRLKEWHQNGQLTDRQLQTLSARYDQRRQAMTTAVGARQAFQREPTYSPRDECWSCKEYLYKNSSHCNACGAPITHPGVRSLRYWRFLVRELRQHEESGALTLRQAHEFLSDTRERSDSLRGKLERERAPMVIPVEDEPAPRRRRHRRDEDSIKEVAPSRTFLELLLDPHSIQWLLAAGGALIVLGLIIWLTSLGLFENAGFVAIALGVSNAALLAGGWALILRSRYQNAGRALTLLACLVMPLNLWFYHTHNLITLDQHLWVAALFCCIVYVASAFVLKDALFVYVLVAGVTLTGFLLLAQMHRFGEIFAPATFFIALGLICLHLERAFPDIDSPFSRRRFGMAFYWSSQPLFAFGLLLLLGAQLVGWLHEPLFRHLGMREPPDVATTAYLPWTLALALAGTYAYVYSDVVVRRIGIYLYLAAITLLWAEIQFLVLADLAGNEAVIIVTLALTALAINVFQVAFKSTGDFLRTIPPLGILLSLIPVMFGTLLHFRATNIVLDRHWHFDITWGHVAAMGVTALCCRAGAYFYRHTYREVSVFYFFATAAATLLFAAGLTWMIGLKPWETEAPLVILVPILYVAASYLYRGRPEEMPLVWAAHAAVGIMLVCSIWAALEITPQVVEAKHGAELNLLLALYCLEVTVFYGLATYLRRTNWTMYFAAVMFSGAVWQLMKFFQAPDEFYIVTFALTGFVLLILYRVGVFERFEMAGLDRGIFQSANALTTLGFAAGALLSLSRLMLHEDQAGEWRQPIRIVLFLLVFLSVVSIVSAWLVQDQIWRRVHLVMTVVNGLLLVLMFHKLSTLEPWQRLEIFAIVIGVFLLIAGYVGWYRETERTSDLVSLAFLFGSLGLAGPLFLASAIHRFGARPSTYDELALVAASIALFGSGVMCRIKTTTIVGTITMVLYVLMVLIYMHRFLRETVIVGIYLTLGGTLLFGTGLFLSVYRDRLLALPEKVRRREGIFRIFDWR